MTNLRDSNSSPQYAIGMSIAFASGRLEDELNVIGFSQWLPAKKEFIANIFDQIFEHYIEYGDVDIAADIVIQCFSYLSAANGLFFTYVDKSEIIQKMAHADLIFLPVLNASERGEREKLIQRLGTEKLGIVVQQLYKSRNEARVKAVLEDSEESTVHDLEKNRIAPIISIFNECSDGIVAYIKNPLLLAELFESYINLGIVAPELALKQFFWSSTQKQPHARTAQVLKRISVSKLIDIINKLEGNWSTKATWLSFCPVGVWNMYLSWIGESYPAECYNIADALVAAAKTDAFVRAVRAKFNDE